MGPESLWFVIGISVFVSLALTTQVVLELQRFRAEDLSGAFIASGLLRELGPLTVSLLWAAQAAARISEDAHLRFADNEDADKIGAFALTKYIAALMASVPLSAYGLVFGFISAAIYAPILGVSSTADFMEAARLTIHEKDLAVFFVKLCVFNPTIAVLCGTACGVLPELRPPRLAAAAATMTFFVGCVLNYVVTCAVYLK